MGVGRVKPGTDRLRHRNRKMPPHQQGACCAKVNKQGGTTYREGLKRVEKGGR